MPFFYKVLYSALRNDIVKSIGTRFWKRVRPKVEIKIGKKSPANPTEELTSSGPSGQEGSPGGKGFY
jgi:maltose-binding protein MalE